MSEGQSPLERAKELAGGSSGLGRALGVSSQAVSQWQQVPASRAADVERVTGISRHELRPDIFGPPAAAGLEEPRVPALVRDADKSRDKGHFSQYFGLQRSHFPSKEDVVEHVRALRDEWDRR